MLSFESLQIELKKRKGSMMYRVHYIFTPHKLETTAAAMEELLKFGKNMVV